MDAGYFYAANLLRKFDHGYCDEILEVAGALSGMMQVAGFQVGPAFPIFPYFFDLILLFPTFS